MKDALTIQELKALCELFFNAGQKSSSFEATFNDVMAGKYQKNIEQTALEIKFREFEADLQKSMAEWDQQQKGKAWQSMADLRDLVFCL